MPAETSEPIRLDVGSGPNPCPGYIQIDADLGHKADDLPYDDGTVDEIRASHVLEHFSHRDTLRVLAHWYKKLKPNGTLKVAVPSFDWIVDKFCSPESAEHPLEQFLLGSQNDDKDWHGALFTTTKLEQAMRLSGFCNIRPWKSDNKDCASLPVSLNLQGTKFAPRPDRLSDVRAVMSMGRLCFSANMFCTHAALHELRVPIVKSDGAFWGQCLTRLLEKFMDDKEAKWFLTIDFDSIFTCDDIVDLYTIAERDQCDALFPVQVGRDRDQALVTIKNADGTMKLGLTNEEQFADSIPVATGHFGLTLIRRELLERMPKPWFHAQHDADGRWGDKRIDEDVFFWTQALKAGGNIRTAPHVKIGHLQQVITWPDHNWRARHQYYNEWAETGTKPEYARH